MNCANHPDAAVAAYCQNCGKPLCTQCVRSVSGVIYCEQCLAAKLGIGGAAVPGGYTVSGTDAGVNYTVNKGGYTVSGSSTGGVSYTVNGVIAPSGPNPSTATVLGFIPGVGAMYNGQFVKALVHVLVFVILIGITDNHPIFGLFIAAWIFYQVFDAHQTAKARRDGLPLPDPFGLNELGAKIGIPNSSATPNPFSTGPYTAGPVNTGASYAGPAYAGPAGPPPPPGASGPVPPGTVPPVAGFAPGGSGYTDPYSSYAAGMPPVEPFQPDYVPRRREPIGAVVLIALGLLFLLNTLGFFRFNWVGHFWPLLIIGLGAWLLIRRTRGIPPPPSPPAPPAGGGQ
jgi:Domain of unknown function (DUF5668)/B-box zinc finger